MPSQLTKPVILITGSSGLIGSRIADRFAGTFRVVGFDRPGVPNPPASADNVPVDLTSDESVVAGLQFVRCYGPAVASVIPLAAYFDFSGEASPLYEQVMAQSSAGHRDCPRSAGQRIDVGKI